MLRFEHITKGYGNKKALNDVSLSFEKGKVYALVGPNGSGKSTIMKIAAGLVKQTSGKCSLNEIPISAKTNAYIAYMSTEPFYYDYMKIKDVGKYYKDFFEDFNEEAYNELINFMQLNMNMKVKGLSSGMSAKLKIAASLSRQAEVIMLDEPLNGIDIIGRDQIINAVIKAASTNESTIIISSHLFDELEPIVDNVVMIDNGKIILEGNIEDIRINTNKSITDIYKEIYSGNIQILQQLNNDFGGNNHA